MTGYTAVLFMADYMITTIINAVICVCVKWAECFFN